jgi:hypothetical protein
MPTELIPSHLTIHGFGNGDVIEVALSHQRHRHQALECTLLAAVLIINQTLIFIILKPSKGPCQQSFATVLLVP